MPAKVKTKPAAVEPINRDNEEIQERNTRLAATLDLKDLDDGERAFLATCQKIYRRDRGTATPFENFFGMLVHSVERGVWPAPDDVAFRLEEFRDDFEFTEPASRRFVEAYPEKPAAHQAGQSKEATHA